MLLEDYPLDTPQGEFHASGYSRDRFYQLLSRQAVKQLAV